MKSNLLHTILICLIAVVFYSCTTKSFKTEEDLWNFLKDENNGYFYHKKINGYDFSLLYKPTDVLVKQELGDSKNTKEISALRKKYSKYMYFNLSMSKNHKELLSVTPKNRNEFGAMVNQLAFGMGDKVHLYNQQKDTIELADFVYPRMYGMSQSTDILFVFPKEKNYLESEYLNFTIEDLGLYTGEIRFKIPIEKINNQPSLKL